MWFFGKKKPASAPSDEAPSAAPVEPGDDWAFLRAQSDLDLKAGPAVQDTPPRSTIADADDGFFSGGPGQWDDVSPLEGFGDDADAMDEGAELTEEDLALADMVRQAMGLAGSPQAAPDAAAEAAPLLDPALLGAGGDAPRVER